MTPSVIILLIAVAVFIPEIIFVYKLFTQKASEVRILRLTLRINFVVFSFACLVLGIVILYDIYYINYKSPMPYSEWGNIEWTDFRAIKRPHETLDGEQKFAYIVTEIKVQFKPDKTAEVISYFHPCRSYTYNEENAGKKLLAHELYHFHITEYYARLIREKISNFNDANLSILEMEIETLKAEENFTQYKYDDETYHGYVSGKQKNWQAQIDSCLNSLEKYSNTIVKFK